MALNSKSHIKPWLEGRFCEFVNVIDMVSNWQKQLRNDVKLLLFLELNKLGQNNDKIDILEDVITSSEATADNDKQIKVVLI